MAKTTSRDVRRGNHRHSGRGAYLRNEAANDDRGGFYEDEDEDEA